MAHRYDVSLKALFLSEGDGIIRRLLFGGKVIEFLATEQPQVFNHRADLVVRTEDGLLHHVEFQTDNEAGFALRMLEYYAYLVRVYKQHVSQMVLYLARQLRPTSIGIGILDAQQESPAKPQRQIEPGPGREGMTEVQQPGRARREP